MARLGIYEVELVPGFKTRVQLDPEEAERRYPDAVEVKTPADGEVKTKSTGRRKTATKSDPKE